MEFDLHEKELMVCYRKVNRIKYFLTFVNIIFRMKNNGELSLLKIKID